MSIPIIGITANTQSTDPVRGAQYVINANYLQAVVNAGGAPVIIPALLHGEALQALLAKLDGVIFSGGSDIDPARFEGVPHPRVYGIDAPRDEQEAQLVRLAVESGKPFLGICRGIQTINVALGGALYTDISDQKEGSLRHDCYPNMPRDYLAHTVEIDPGSALARITGETSTGVNSLHHQGISRPAAALKPVAYAPDGLVEAVELPGHPFGLGVQWHPECLPHIPQQQALFRALIQAASQLTAK